MSSLVGSPTNLVCPRILTLLYPGAPEISFTSWMVFALPVSVVMLVAVFFVIYLFFRPREKWKQLDRAHFKKAYSELGKASQEERIVFVLFLSLALLWITRTGISFNGFTIPGWARIFKVPPFINDGIGLVFDLTLHKYWFKIFRVILQGRRY